MQVTSKSNVKLKESIHTGYNWEPNVGCWYCSAFFKTGGVDGTKGLTEGWVETGGTENLS